MGRRFLTIILTVVIAAAGVGFFPSAQSHAAANPPEAAADAAVLIDASTGKVLFEKEKDKQKFPASTTKVMTALLVCENLDFSKTVTVDADTPFTKGARVYLMEGEQLTVEQLFLAMMTESANDAAVALAKEVSGSVEEFAALMNQRAKELGAVNSNFATPNGLHDPNHVSTAYDLALIAREGMRHEEFRTAVSTYRYHIPATNMQEERFLYNSNRLLYDTKRTVTVDGVKRPIKYDEATGIKTGFTTEAGNCLIASAKRGDTELIAVVLESNALYQDAISLLEYGFSNYKSVPVMAAGETLGEVKVRRGSVKTVTAVTDRDIIATLPSGVLDSSIAKKMEFTEDLKAPVEAGQKIGTVKIYDNTQTLLGEFDAVAKQGVSPGGILSVVGIDDRTAAKIFRVILIVVLVPLALVIAYVLLKRRQVRKRRLRRQKREERIRRREAEAQRYWEELHVAYPRSSGSMPQGGGLEPKPEDEEARRRRAREQDLKRERRRMSQTLSGSGPERSDRPFTAEKQEKRKADRKEEERRRKEERKKQKGEKRKERRRRSRSRTLEGEPAGGESGGLTEEERERLKYLHVTKL